MTRRHSVGLALLAAAALAAWLVPERGAGADERRGRVVRVERPRLTAGTQVQGCLSFAMDAKTFTCFGRRPEPGDTFQVVDQEGELGSARVVTSEPSVHDQCRAGVAHDVELEYEVGPRRSVSGKGLSLPVAVSGLEADSAAVKVLSDPNSMRSPSGRQGENVWIALDRDGDQAVDFMATAYENCEEALANAPVAPAGRRVHALCLDYWSRDGSDWRVVNRDQYYNCYNY